jgi:hypothetical protein
MIGCYKNHGGYLSNYELELEMKKIKRESRIHRVHLETLDEIEISTPTNEWVVGCDQKGELIIGETKTSPSFIKTVSINNREEAYSFNIKLGHDVKRILRIGKGTPYTKLKVFLMGRDILLRPVRVLNNVGEGVCIFCEILIEDAPSNRKPCRLKVDDKILNFCCKQHRKKWKKENVGKAGLNLEPTH